MAPRNSPAEARTVLLVEDEPLLLALAQRMLERLGFRVLAAGSPEQALAMARDLARPLELLVTDVMMPGMSGRELCQALRSTRPGLACLYMSGYTEDVLSAEDPGPERLYFIQKPFRFASLARAVETVLEAQSAH